MEKAILLLAETEGRLRFFERFVNTIKIKGYVPCFIVGDYSLVKKESEKCCYLRKKDNSYIYDENIFSTCYENILGLSDVSHLREKANSMGFVLNDLHKKYDIKYIFMWNGTFVMERVARCFAKKNNIEMRFFELANIPGKLFCDRAGVNRESLVYIDTAVLDMYEVDEKKYSKWFDKYYKIKTSNYVIPQARKDRFSYFDKIKDVIIDYYGYIFMGGINCNNRNLIRRFLKKIKKDNRGAYSEYSSVGNEEKYVFFPMQCSGDTQLLLNSNVDNIEAAEIAYEYAVMNKLKLVIKPHPAEADVEYISNFIRKLREKNIECVMTNDNTFELIMKSKKVFTINSTVGLEAMILGKSLSILGYSMYERFNKKRLMAYISSYLIDVEPFGYEDINESDFNRILNR